MKPHLALSLSFLFLILVAGCSKREMSEAELAALVTLEDVRHFGGHYPQARVTRDRRTDMFGGAVQFEYWVETPESASEYLSLRTQAGWSIDEGGARTTYQAMKLGLRVGGLGLDIADRSEELSYGDESFFGDLLYEGEPVGNVFHCRDGNAFLVVMVAGFHAEDPALWLQMITPRLESLKRLASGGRAAEET